MSRPRIVPVSNVQTSQIPQVTSQVVPRITQAVPQVTSQTIQVIQPIQVTGQPTRPVIVQPIQPPIAQVSQPTTQLPTQAGRPIVRVTQPIRVQPTQTIPAQPTQLIPAQAAPVQPVQFAPGLAFLAGPTAIVTTPAIDKLRRVWAGTPEEYFQLQGLTYPDGTPIIESADSDVLSVIADMLIQAQDPESFTQVVQFLSQVRSPRDIIFNRPEYQKHRLRQARELFVINQKPVAAEGIATCASCGSKKVTFIQLQNRSGDEGMTTKFTCANSGCGHKWATS